MNLLAPKAEKLFGNGGFGGNNDFGNSGFGGGAGGGNRNNCILTRM